MITGNKNDIIAYLMNEGIETTWDLSPHVEKKHRSLDSNAYFHVLCDKLRQELGISLARCKNHLIADYGQIEYIDDAPMIYKTNAPEEYMMELETIHTKCIRVQEENGINVYFYRVYRGSHTYNSIEMNKLITGTVEECKAQGIETLTPIELQRMNEEWKQRHG
jgi:hypothetical protein